MTIRLVEVDAFGITADGDDIRLRASDETVRDGHMRNEKVIARFPDGKQRVGNIIHVTAAGLQFLKRSVPLALRNPEGTA